MRRAGRHSPDPTCTTIAYDRIRRRAGPRHQHRALQRRLACSPATTRRGDEEYLGADRHLQPDPKAATTRPARTCATRRDIATRRSSREGWTLFVEAVAVRPGRSTTGFDDDYTYKARWPRGCAGTWRCCPHESAGVSTALVRWAPDTRFNTHSHPGGEEILVLQGLFRDEQGEYPAGTWLRSPRWSRHTPFTGAEGALIYVKVGHLGVPFLVLPSAG